MIYRVEVTQERSCVYFVDAASKEEAEDASMAALLDIDRDEWDRGDDEFYVAEVHVRPERRGTGRLSYRNNIEWSLEGIQDAVRDYGIWVGDHFEFTLKYERPGPPVGPDPNQGTLLGNEGDTPPDRTGPGIVDTPPL